MTESPSPQHPSLQPFDDHNRRLLDEVHPQDWKNPEPADRYHLVVIGAGTAGLVSAAGAAGLGAKVALVERHFMGGDCLNVGCVPSKGVIAAARAWHAAGPGGRPFGAPEATGEGDFAAAMERMRRLRANISPIDGAARFRDLGIDVFLGEARFIAADAIEVDGRRLHFRRAVIATGGRAAIPPIPGLDSVPHYTNETIFSLTERPQRLGVIGGGPIGCELAQSFARFGSEVHLFDHGPRILSREDPKASEMVQQTMERDGVHFHLGAGVDAIERGSDGKPVVIFGKERIPVDALLIAAGRRPNVDNLGLEAAGIQYEKQGLLVDDNLRTTNSRVFGAGDVASRYQFTHAADAMSRMVLRNAFFFGRQKVSDLVIPWTTYTSPEVAHVGLYPREAEERGIAIDTFTLPFDDLDRALLDGESEGFLKVHVKRGSDRIVGGTVVAAHAGDLIGYLSLAMRQNLGLAAFSTTVFPYPTQGEVFRKAGDAYQRTRLTDRARAFFRWWFKIFS